MALTAIAESTSMAMESDIQKVFLTDLHTHILPGIDDGAKNLERSVEILLAQKASGVERVALTPHYYPLREELEAFLEKRQKAYEQLRLAWDEETMPQLRLGAEVHYAASLAEMDLRKLTLGQSDYLLLELSDTAVPAHIEQVLAIILEQGITPILAHIERCSYFCEEPARLVGLIEMGALAQVSALALARTKANKFADVCLRNHVAQIIASDVHGIGKGMSCLGDFAKKIDKERVIRAETFARAVWDNSQLPAFEPIPVRKRIFGYA